MTPILCKKHISSRADAHTFIAFNKNIKFNTIYYFIWQKRFCQSAVTGFP